MSNLTTMKHNIPKILTVIISILTVTILISYLLGAYNTFTWKKWALYDFGVYTNMVWNCGHGDFFKCLVDRSYLSTHLSFTLALLGPLYLIWDHPLVLMYVQWFSFVGGCFFCLCAARKHRLNSLVTAVFMFFFVAYPFTQSVLFSSFHGVTLYFLLIPWLYYFLVYYRKWVWIPLVLLLGLREDAFLFALPMILYFSIKDRWKFGYVYFSATLIYGILALTVIYPAINGISLWERRSAEIGGGGLLSLGEVFYNLKVRLPTILWVLLPTSIFLGRAWPRILVFIAVPLLTTFGSSFSRQYLLRNHYPAIIMACLAVGILEALRYLHQQNLSGSKIRLPAMCTVLCVIVLFAHSQRGFLWYGENYHRRISSPHPSGREIMEVVQHIPKHGLLLIPSRLGGVCSIRSDFLSWKQYEPEKHDVDIFFAQLRDFAGKHGEKYRKILSDGEFGVSYFKDDYVILEKGYSNKENLTVQIAVTEFSTSIPFARTHRHQGTNIRLPTGKKVRYWNGKGVSDECGLAFGKRMKLTAGEYHALVYLKSEVESEQTGFIHVTLIDIEHGKNVLVDISFKDELRMKDDFYVLNIPFSIQKNTLIEPRISAADVEVWLDRIQFISTKKEKILP